MSAPRSSSVRAKSSILRRQAKKSAFSLQLLAIVCLVDVDAFRLEQVIPASQPLSPRWRAPVAPWRVLAAAGGGHMRACGLDYGRLGGDERLHHEVVHLTGERRRERA